MEEIAVTVVVPFERMNTRPRGTTCSVAICRTTGRFFTSAIAFDFWDWAMERYEGAVAEFTGPNLARLLDDVQADD